LSKMAKNDTEPQEQQANDLRIKVEVGFAATWNDATTHRVIPLQISPSVWRDPSSLNEILEEMMIRIRNEIRRLTQ